jgi:hypothetical protein
MAAVRERGQLILVGGLALAVMLVAIALVLNAAIYTENLASRNDADRIDGANAVRNDVRAGLVGAVEHVNESQSFGDQTDDANASMTEIENETGYYAAQDGASLSIGNASYEEGRRLARDSEGQFVSSDAGQTTYPLVDDGTVHEHSMNVSKDSLRERGEITDAMGDLTGDDVFNATYSNASSGVERSVFVYNESDQVTVEVYDENGDRIGSVCNASATDGHAAVDVTEGTVAGDSCAALGSFDALGSTYDLEYGGTGNANGTYEVTVNVTGGTAYDQHAPASSATILAAETTIIYRSPELYYRTTIRYDPGDPIA